MPLSNVFISSRMEELAFERRSVFDALYLSGLTPLAFETEPTAKTEKEMIDTLVDSSDLFVGIYHETIGAPQTKLAGLEPIAYELYRFLLRHSNDEARALAKARKHVEERAVLNALIKDKESISNLRSRIRAGSLNALLSGRVRLLQMTHHYDSTSSRRLTEFLLPFQQALIHSDENQHAFVHYFQAAEDRVTGPVIARAKKCTRFLTGRFQLFSLINRLIEEAKRKTKFRIHASHDVNTETPHFRWIVSGRDQPGVLYVVLDALFRMRFNLSMVCSGEPESTGLQQGRPQLIIDIVGRPFLPDRDDSVAIEDRFHAVTNSLRKALPKRYIIEDQHLPDWPRHRLSAYRGEKEHSDRYYYVVETADVPGQVLGIASKILFYEANIDLLFYDSRSDLRESGDQARVATVLFVVSPSSRESRFVEPMHQARFITELRQGLGVLNVRELNTADDFFGHLKKSNRRIREWLRTLRAAEP